MGSWRWACAGLAAILVFNLITNPGFFAIEIKQGFLYGSLVDILNRAAPTMLVAVGMMLVIATGGIDLSVGSIIAITGAIAAVQIQKSAVSWAVIESVALACVLGLWNGALVAFGGIQPIVATLILLVAGRGIAQLVTNGQIVTFTDAGLSSLGSGHFLGLPTSIGLVIGAVILIFLLVRQTALGFMIECGGASPRASRYTGINVRSVQVAVYAISGLCAGLAGLLVVAETRAADANNSGLYIELDAILAVVIGGTFLTGGRFSIIGTVFGSLMIQALSTTVLTRGVSAEWTLVLKAALVLSISVLQSGGLRGENRRRELG